MKKGKFILILSVLEIFFIPFNSSMGEENFTRAGRTLLEIRQIYGSSSDLVRIRLQKGELNEVVFLIEPIKFHISDASFKDCSFVRIFSTGNISHYIHAYAVVSSKTKKTWLTNDEETISFLQTAQNEINSEEIFRQYILTFASLRSYDVLTEKPDLLEKDKAELHDIPSDLVWGISPYRTKKGSFSVL